MRIFFKRKPYSFLLLVQILFVQHSYAQQSLSDSLFKRFRNDVKDELFRNNGRSVWDDETRESYYLLMSTIPIQYLLKYTNDSIPSVRSKIFVGLVQKGADDSSIKEILNNHKDDTAVFIEAVTDVIQIRSVTQYMQFIYQNNESFPRTDFNTRLDKIREKKKDLHIIIPGVRHGIVSKQDLLKIDSLVCSEEGFQIVSFELYARKKTLTANSLITKQMKRLLGELKSKNLIQISKVKCLGPDKNVRYLSSFNLMVR